MQIEPGLQAMLDRGELLKALRSLKRGLIFLTRFAVDTRYPGDNASKRQAVAALRWAQKVRKAARALLDIRDRRRK